MKCLNSIIFLTLCLFGVCQAMKIQSLYDYLQAYDPREIRSVKKSILDLGSDDEDRVMARRDGKGAKKLLYFQN